jgi:hypothetical protein
MTKVIPTQSLQRKSQLARSLLLLNAKSSVPKRDPEPTAASVVPTVEPVVPPPQDHEAIPTVEPIVPPPQNHEDTVNEDEEGKLPPTIALANARLDEAGEKLKQKIPEDILASSTFKIKASADINSLADNIGAALVTMMDQRKIEKAKQSKVKTMITEWAKKTLPFVEKGLTLADVQSYHSFLADFCRT